MKVNSTSKPLVVFPHYSVTRNTSLPGTERVKVDHFISIIMVLFVSEKKRAAHNNFVCVIIRKRCSGKRLLMAANQVLIKQLGLKKKKADPENTA